MTKTEDMAEIQDFYRLLGLEDPSVAPPAPVIERPQFVSAENPRVQFVVRLSGRTQPFDLRGKVNG